MSDLLEELRAIVEKLSTQPNAGSSDPYYTVQQKVKDWGIDPNYHESTGHAWVLDGEEIDDPTEWCAENDEGPFDPDDPPDGMRQVWYRERWEHVHAFLTQEAALAFMKREAHNHGPLRTYVESACRNREMRWVCTLPARALEAIAAAERERDEARAEVARLTAMINEAGEGAFNVLALLDLYQSQITEADERAALAYPRALQAAADVVLVAPAPAEVDEADWLAYQDDLANVILELSAEQIDACDAKVEEAAQVAEHYVCPGCHVVDEEPCLPGCIDAEIEGERRTPFDGFSEFMADDDGDESEEGGDHG